MDYTHSKHDYDRHAYHTNLGRATIQNKFDNTAH